jgi:hypothetical protein
VFNGQWSIYVNDIRQHHRTRKHKAAPHKTPRRKQGATCHHVLRPKRCRQISIGISLRTNASLPKSQRKRSLRHLLRLSYDMPLDTSRPALHLPSLQGKEQRTPHFRRLPYTLARTTLPLAILRHRRLARNNRSRKPAIDNLCTGKRQPPKEISTEIKPGRT